MNSLQDSFKSAMDLLPVIVFTGISDMLRPIVAPEIEGKLGRKLTDQEWHFYLRERYRKANAEYHQQIVRQWCQRLIDRKIIYDFVWEEKGRESQ